MDMRQIRNGLRDVSESQSNIPSSCELFTYTDTKASEKVLAIITSPYLCTDVTRLSAAHQTSSLESFHSLVIHFAPKSLAFSYRGMECRYESHISVSKV